MTIQELAAKMRALAGAIADARVVYVATTSTMDVMSDRIWGRGELTDGGRLPYKGPTPKGFYAYVPPFPKKGSGKGKTGRKIKGAWAPSYHAAKDQIGRGDLPFELTGDMRKDWLGGAVPTPHEVTPLMCEIRVNSETGDKIDGLTTTKGKFVQLAEEEKRKHHEHVLEAYRFLVLDQW